MGRRGDVIESRYEFLQRMLSGPIPDDCMIWPFEKDKKGYGRLHVPPNWNRKALAHREAYRFYYGHYPEPCGSHICDTPGCYNPKHIEASTVLKNNRDMHLRGRAVNQFGPVAATKSYDCSYHVPTKKNRGVHNGQSKLTPAKVRSIRTLYAAGNLSQAMIGKRFGVGQNLISLIVLRQRWGHIK